MTDSRKMILLVIASFSMFMACLLVADSILPENCPLFGSRQTGLLCDGLDLENPLPCEICVDEAGAGTARIVAGFGFCFLFFPFIFFAIRKKLKSPIAAVKLFD